jgi:hypothetical protein
MICKIGEDSIGYQSKNQSLGNLYFGHFSTLGLKSKPNFAMSEKWKLISFLSSAKITRPKRY